MSHLYNYYGIGVSIIGSIGSQEDILDIEYLDKKIVNEQTESTT